MLELPKLLDNVAEMSVELARREVTYGVLAEKARMMLQATPVDDVLRRKITRALEVDSTWRGAEPIEDRLDIRQRPLNPPVDASLIGVDGSQIYPDRHGATLYYLLNIGSIVLRQGSGEAPVIETTPTLFYDEEDLYDDQHNLVMVEHINALRELAEMRTLAELAASERSYWGGDRDRLVVVLKDGQLMMWISERDPQQLQSAYLTEYIDQLGQIQRSGGAPVGFVGRPRSDSVVRLLWVAGLQLEAITRQTVRESEYRALTDRLLYEGLLGPNERSALFASTAVANRGIFSERGQKVCFFYLNVAERQELDAAQIVRVDVPMWLAAQPELLAQTQNAIYQDCQSAGFPYVLSRADELAVVAQHEKRDFESMLAVAMAQATGAFPQMSAKARQKEQLRGYVR